MTRVGAALVLALALAARPAGACEPYHDWEVVEDGSSRELDVGLLRDAARWVFAAARVDVTRLALLGYEDGYLGGAPAATPRPASQASRDALAASFRAAGVAMAPDGAVRALLAKAGPDSEYLPATLADIARKTDASHFLRVSLVHYAGTRVRERDRFSVNAGLEREQHADFVTARIALLDAAGAVLWIDEVRATQTRDQMYWDRPGGRELVETLFVPYIGEPEKWHDETRHPDLAGTREVGEIRFKEAPNPAPDSDTLAR